MKLYLYPILCVFLLVLVACDRDTKEAASICLNAFLAERPYAEICRNRSETDAKAEALLAINHKALDSILKVSQRQTLMIDSLRGVLASIAETDDLSAAENQDSLSQDVETQDGEIQEVEAQDAVAEKQAVVESVEEPVLAETPETSSVENAVEKSADETASEASEVGGGWRKFAKKIAPEAISIAGGAVAGAAIAKATNCDRYELSIEYKLMEACITGCGNTGASREERIENCARNIMAWQCKEKIKPGQAMSKAQSCSLR